MLQTATDASAADKAANRCGGDELTGHHRTSRLRTASGWRGTLREARSGEAAAETERNKRGKSGKPMAGLCLRRFVRWARTSEGAGLAVLLASAVTERSKHIIKAVQCPTNQLHLPFQNQCVSVLFLCNSCVIAPG